MDIIYNKPIKSNSSKLGIVLSTKLIDKYVRKYIEKISTEYKSRQNIIFPKNDKYIFKQETKIKIRLTYNFIYVLSSFLNYITVSILRDAVTKTLISYNTRVNYRSVILVIHINKFIQRLTGLSESDIIKLFELENNIADLSEETNVFNRPLGFGINIGKKFIKTHPSIITDMKPTMNKIKFKYIKKDLTNNAKLMHTAKPTTNEINKILNSEKNSNKLIKVTISKKVNFAINYIISKILNHILDKIFSIAYNASSVTFSIPVLKYVIEDIAKETINKQINTINFDNISRITNLKILKNKI